MDAPSAIREPIRPAARDDPGGKPVLPLKLVIPLVLGIIVSLAIAGYAELAFRRLEVANRQIAVALEMEATLHETLALVVDAETGQRGYLLTGKDEYLQPYEAAVPKVGDAIHRLRELLAEQGTAAQRDILGQLNNLVGRKLLELEAAIALYRKDGPEVAQALLNPGIGRRAMDDIRATIDTMTTNHRQQLQEATNQWARDIEFARVGMQIMTAFTVALLLIVWLLSRRDAKQREERRHLMQEDKQRLEALVEARTAISPSCRTTCRWCAKTRRRSSPATSTTSWAGSWSAPRWMWPGWKSG